MQRATQWIHKQVDSLSQDWLWKCMRSCQNVFYEQCPVKFFSWSTMSISWRSLIKRRSCPWKLDLWATVPEKMTIRQMTILSMLPGVDLISASRARPWSQFSVCEQVVRKATYLFILQGEVKPSHCSLEIFVKWMNVSNSFFFSTG